MKKLFFCLFLTGCTTLVKVPEATTVKENPDEAWATVLSRFVDETGRIDFAKLSHDSASLKAYVSYVSRVSPKSNPDKFPTRDSQIAFYLNSYNALSMYNIIDGGIPESLSGLTKVKFFYLRKFIIGGQEMSLYDYENKIIRKQGEERVHFALNCMSVGCPRLPRNPFSSENLQTQLNAQAKLFFSEERNLKIDANKKQVLVSEILKFFTEDFLKKSPTLIHYINQYVTNKIPDTYEVEFIPYDWRVNSQTKKVATKAKRRHHFRFSKWETRLGSNEYIGK